MDNSELLERYLFRGRRIDNGEWKEGSLLVLKDTSDKVRAIICPVNYNFARVSYPNHDLEIGFWKEVDPATVGQFTGLTDDNGVKIFDGDILKISVKRWSNEPFIFESPVFRYNASWRVRWSNKRERIMLKQKIMPEKSISLQVGVKIDDFSDSTDFEIIGSIHDRN